MKAISKITLFVLGLFCVSGCDQKHDAPLTPEESENIRNEVTAAAEPLMTGWAGLDGPTAMKSFSRDMAACYDTLLMDYNMYAESWTIYTNARDSIKIIPVKKDFIILSRELVIYTWAGNVNEWMKTGEKISYRPIRYTNLFKKAGGKWKIIFHQSSGIPVVEVNPIPSL